MKKITIKGYVSDEHYAALKAALKAGNTMESFLATAAFGVQDVFDSSKADSERLEEELDPEVQTYFKVYERILKRLKRRS